MKFVKQIIHIFYSKKSNSLDYNESTLDDYTWNIFPEVINNNDCAWTSNPETTSNNHFSLV